MAEYDDRERFIPLTKHELVDMLCQEEHLSDDDKGKFRDFCKVLESLFHFEYHETLEKLKEAYAPFDPDRDTIAQHDWSDDDRRELQMKLVEGFGEAAEGANYEVLSDKELHDALEGWSPFGGINLRLDLDHYVEYKLYYRGAFEDVRKVRLPQNLIKFNFKKTPVSVKVYKRLAILAKIKDRGRKTRKWDTDHIFIKLFKNVPAADLEMLFPTTKPAMKKLDFVMIWLPIFAGIATLVLKFLLAYLSGAPLSSNQIAALDPKPGAGVSVPLDSLPGALPPAIAAHVSYDTLRHKLRSNSPEGLTDADRDALLALAEDNEAWAESVDELYDMSHDPPVSELIDQGAIFVVKDGVKQDAAATRKALVEKYGAPGRAPGELPKGVEVLRKGSLNHALKGGLLAGGAVAIFVLLASWTFKSVMKYFKAKQKYVGALAQNLFYLNLDNNAGVFGHLIDSAEEEECKEAFFAYFFLNTVKDRTFTEEELDDYVESWIEQHCQQPVKDPQTGEESMQPLLVDFEIEDALGKLQRLQLLTRHADGRLEVLEWDKALERLDYIWDNYFDYNDGSLDEQETADAAAPAPA